MKTYSPKHLEEIIDTQIEYLHHLNEHLLIMKLQNKMIKKMERKVKKEEKGYHQNLLTK